MAIKTNLSAIPASTKNRAFARTSEIRIGIASGKNSRVANAELVAELQSGQTGNLKKPDLRKSSVMRSRLKGCRKMTKGEAIGTIIGAVLGFVKK